ncbi:hypothetical protein CEXT_667661 [Caerostris extrusa]|uniref:Secreted protein n=1 Tax=Caerostris extrusa TaxID=172846 RepID=A0AAV4VCA9_CAEEX|nr:hypothetical protein CEXT_667661 [Caerostris extrusa]
MKVPRPSSMKRTLFKFPFIAAKAFGRVPKVCHTLLRRLTSAHGAQPETPISRKKAPKATKAGNRCPQRTTASPNNLVCVHFCKPFLWGGAPSDGYRDLRTLTRRGWY